MTYKENYMQCETEEELLTQVKQDTEIALLMGSHARIKVIKKAAEEVIAEKFSKGGAE
jgi:hypothetical protein